CEPAAAYMTGRPFATEFQKLYGIAVCSGELRNECGTRTTGERRAASDPGAGAARAGPQGRRRGHHGNGEGRAQGAPLSRRAGRDNGELASIYSGGRIAFRGTDRRPPRGGEA